MKSQYYMTLAALACVSLFSMGALNAIDEETQPQPLENIQDDRIPFTAEEKNIMHEERISYFPKELLQNTGLFDYKEDFRDSEHLWMVHKDASHTIFGSSLFGDEMELEDGSKWAVSFLHRAIVKDWHLDDLLYIKPKCSWFSYYEYVIQNRTTGEHVDVNLLTVPLLNTPSSLTIVYIDSTNRIVQLCDGTSWQINVLDYSFRKWRVGDRLIVGVNNYWRMERFAHILINTSYFNNPYCEAKLVAK